MNNKSTVFLGMHKKAFSSIRNCPRNRVILRNILLDVENYGYPYLKEDHDSRCWNIVFPNGSVKHYTFK